MARETKKKVVDEISKCFMCSFTSASQGKVSIFGISIHNFVEIIRSSLDFDISCSASSTVVYMQSCVLQATSENWTSLSLELKREILQSFQERPWAKRLHNAGDERSRAAAIHTLPVSSTIRAKASKSLQFSGAEDVCVKSTICVSSCSNNQGQLTDLTPLINVGFSIIQRINPLSFVLNLLLLVFLLRSRRITIQCPSKIVNK